jgi:predicted nucleic acid-binding protein
MSRYVLDTNIVLGMLRDAPYAKHVLNTFQPFSAPNLAVQSITSVAELEALGFRLKWGNSRFEKLAELIRKIPQQDINHPSILRMYAEIDAYRQNGHPETRLPSGQSAFAMGDNDIWIAATASVMKASLLTTDKDFLPLNGIFLDVIWIDPKGCYESP